MSKEKEKASWASVDKTGMMLDGYVKVNNALIREIAINCSPNAAAIYILILSHKNNSDRFSWPSVSLLQKEAALSRTGVKTCLTQLVEGGYLFISSGNSLHSNRYYFPREPFFRETDIVGLSRTVHTTSPKKRDTLPSTKKPLVDKKEKTPPKPQDIDSLPVTVEDEFEGFEF